jgi:hypothetical protein
MLFRLHNGALVILEDKWIDLSEFLTKIHQEAQPLELLSAMLQKSAWKKVKPVLLKILEETCGLQCEEAELKQLSLADSDLTKAIQERISLLNPASDRVACEEALQYIREHVDTIFEPLIHHIRFLKDDVFLLILEYLQISSSSRDSQMFKGLPYLLQGCPPGTDIKTVLDPALHGYIDFISKIQDDTMLLELAKASCLLNIQSLTELVGCKLAIVISESNEKTIRQKYNVPSKFRDAIMEKVRSMVKEQEWIKASPIRSEMMKNMQGQLSSPCIKQPEVKKEVTTMLLDNKETEKMDQSGQE